MDDGRGREAGMAVPGPNVHGGAARADVRAARGGLHSVRGKRKCPECGDERWQIVSEDETLGWCYGGGCGAEIYATEKGKRAIKDLLDKT